jgi:hypothetical protein
MYFQIMSWGYVPIRKYRYSPFFRASGASLEQKFVLKNEETRHGFSDRKGSMESISWGNSL